MAKSLTTTTAKDQTFRCFFQTEGLDGRPLCSGLTDHQNPNGQVTLPLPKSDLSRIREGNSTMNQQSSGTLAALLVPNTDVALQLRWAARLAAARKLDLLLFHREQSTDTRIVEVSLEQLNEGESLEIVNEVLRVIQDSPELCCRISRDREDRGEQRKRSNARTSFKSVLKLSILRTWFRVGEPCSTNYGTKSAELFTQARSQPLDLSDVDLVKATRTPFIRYIPCNVVLCSGLKEGQTLQRILVATQTGPQGKAVLQLARDLASLEKGSFTALHVNPDIGPDAERVGNETGSPLR